jgi:hypothetical protein
VPQWLSLCKKCVASSIPDIIAREIIIYSNLFFSGPRDAEQTGTLGASSLRVGVALFARCEHAYQRVVATTGCGQQATLQNG